MGMLTGKLSIGVSGCRFFADYFQTAALNHIDSLNVGVIILAETFYDDFT